MPARCWSGLASALVSARASAFSSGRAGPVSLSALVSASASVPAPVSVSVSVSDGICAGDPGGTSPLFSAFSDAGPAGVSPGVSAGMRRSPTRPSVVTRDSPVGASAVTSAPSADALTPPG
ncbi:hypothetical protein GCM10017559_60010 [Streptosporangium longisporum]|uniref:Secreted protein n=1 Tax=Streptosporangium longisporum TaxID=46187 RepID=A0ABN3YDB5_9ACTN